MEFAPYAVFAGMLAMAGLPIYIHAPKYFVDEYGIGLAALGAVLFALRLLDVVQDPILGWLSRRLSAHRQLSVSAAAVVMALAMLGLFAVTPPFAPLLWFALMLGILFSAFSFLSISFYAEGVATARRMGGNSHIRLAGWRETGALIGVSIASVAPLVLLSVTESPFAAFAALFAVLTMVAVSAMRNEWRDMTDDRSNGMAPVLRDPLSRRLLLIALLNATPVAVTSTLFLFFVESRLGASGWEGPLLLLFFLSAAGAAPVWSRVAQSIGAKPTLMLGMALSIAAFAGAALLGPGDIAPFVVICLFSGVALGADMTLLPALFAARSSEIASEAAEGFGLWSFVSKFSLAFAAVLLLPLLEANGFQAGSAEQTGRASLALTLSYAVFPCGLKLIALLLLASTPLDTVAKPALSRGNS